jgi:dihydrofolate reductase
MSTRQIAFDLIVAKTINNGIGLNNKIPWKLSKDLKMFKKITTSGNEKNAIIMGRKTF